MHHVGLAPLAGSVSRAGGLGVITALSCSSPEHLREEIAKARKICGTLPLGVNLTLLPSLVPKNYDAYADVVVEAKIPVVETAGHVNGLKPFVEKFKKNNIIVIHKCTQVRHAKTAQRMGVDMISMDGFECAGHPGEADIGNFVLLAQAQRELEIPFICSGGVANGNQLAAALQLGAVGVNMGTRFMATVEAPIHDNVKNAIVKGGIDSTSLIMRTMKNTERVYNNAAVQQVQALEKQFPGDFSKIHHLVKGDVYKKVFQETGDIDQGVWSAGICMVLIDDIPTCQVLIENMVRDAILSLNATQKMIATIQ